MVNSGVEVKRGGRGGVWRCDIVLAFGLLLFMTLLVVEQVSIKLIKFSENSFTYSLRKE